MSNKAFIKLELDLDSEKGIQFFTKLSWALGASDLDAVKLEGAPVIQLPVAAEPVKAAAPRASRAKAKTGEEKGPEAGDSEEKGPEAVSDAGEVAEKGPEAGDNTGTTTVTLDDLRTKTTAKAKLSRDAIKKELMDKWGANNVASLSPEHYEAYDKYLDTLPS